jgi:2-polyprenyl-3-methyl-5-hydroxy-6-metoxy-1,4-benzoquinol methylase
MSWSEWLVAARNEYLKDAAFFLRDRGLISESDTLDSLFKRWPQFVREDYNPERPDDFYSSWTGKRGASNIIANIVDQFGREYFVAAMAAFFAPPYSYSGTILDFGSGTAAVSLPWHWSFAPHARLLLADVENLPREFVRHEATQHPECKVEFIDISLKEAPDHSIDIAFCIDVLEHLPNPSEVFFNLHRKLKSGGLLFIQAPWGGHPEHLDCAPIDWENNGGAQRIKSEYNHLLQMNDAVSLSGVYLKKFLD